MRLDYHAIRPQVPKYIHAAGQRLKTIDSRLRALVELRVSQINGCVYCVDAHSEQARAAGESQQRLDGLVAWRESAFYSPRERAALAWAESVTHVSQTLAPDDVYEGLCEHFHDEEIVDLTWIIAMMNALNRVAVSFRKRPELRDEG